MTPSFSRRSVAVTWLHPGREQDGLLLAEQLSLPILDPAGQEPGLVLRFTEYHLELLCPAEPALSGPARVEFVNGAAGYRRRHRGGEMLLRAVGLRQGHPLHVFDATGGFGRDAFLLASHGCTVRVVEQNPLVGALLADGLLRALAHPETKEAAARITLEIGDSLQVLEKLAQEGAPAPVVYLDPMFPERSKSAKVKKDMQVLQLLVGGEENGGELLAAALAAADSRVVVKRSKGAPPLPGPAPSHSLGGKTTRFDVYLRPRWKAKNR